VATLRVSLSESEPRASGPTLTATGRIVSDHQVQVSTKVSGQIVALYFEQGDKIENGQLLARIEDINYRARRDEASAMLTKARATLEYARWNHERIKGMAREQHASDVELADAVRALDEAEAAKRAAEASLEWWAKALLDTQVTAPISGVVLERNVEVGDFVAAEGGRGAMANSQFATIADMTKLRVEVDISEMDISRLHAGMHCTIVPDAYKDRRYSGHILWIDPGANYSKATVQVKVRINDPDDYLRVEGSAQVSFLADESAPASDPATIWIPTSAIRLAKDGTKASVFVVREGRVAERAVELGRTQANQAEVRSGLSAGDMIIRDSVERLTDGQRVKAVAVSTAAG
jgi:RND family efflux transporter MFP subunit